MERKLPQYTIGVDARASFGGDDVPELVLSVDGRRVGSTMVRSHETRHYAFTADLTPDVAHTVSIAFPNQTSSAQMLAVRSISVGGTAIGVDSPTETYVSSAGTFRGWGEMYFGGRIDFALPAAVFPVAAATAPASAAAEAASVVPAPAQVAPAPTQAAPAPAPAEGTFYVSTEGSDTGDGGRDRPFATLQRAVDAMEGAGVKELVVLAGTYGIESALRLDGENRGFTITGSGGVVLDGGGTSGILRIEGGSGITVSGLTFRGAAGPAVEVVGGAGNTITANGFEGNGGAVLLRDDARGNTVSNNKILSSEESAIELKDGSDDNVIDSNLIDGVGAQETYGGGIYLHGASGNQITHNLVKNTQGAAINLADFYATSTGTQNIGNTIAYNRIEDANLSATDSGAIYILGRSNADTQTLVEMNFIDGTGRADRHSVGIYLDDCTNGVTATGNIVTGIGSDGFQIHGGSDNTFSDNIFDLGSGTPSAGLFQMSPQDVHNPDPLRDNVVTNNIVATASATPRPAYAFLDGGDPAIAGNEYWTPPGVRLDASPDANPSYATRSLSGDYATGGNAIGFAAIDLSQIGLRPTGAHAY